MPSQQRGGKIKTLNMNIFMQKDHPRTAKKRALVEPSTKFGGKVLS